MAIKKSIVLGCILFLLCSHIAAQQNRNLNIGDKLPDIEFKKELSTYGRRLNLPDLYKGKLLLVNFWATWCGPCIKEMEFLDSLKKQHPNQFNVIMVTRQDSTAINTFLSRKAYRHIDKAGLFFITNDTLFNKLFPHKIIPHNIWIDSTGTVKAVTSGKEINRENILGFYKDKAMPILKTKTDVFDFDFKEEFHYGDTSFMYRSIIVPMIDVGTSGVYGGSVGINPRRFFQWNASITHLYYNAYSLYSDYPGNWRDNLIEVHTKDSLRLFYPSGKNSFLLKGSKYKDFDEWGIENKFCYALTLPHRVPHNVFREYMFNDLHRQFKVRAQIENRKMTCVVVRGKPHHLVKNKEVDSAKKARIYFSSAKLLKISNAKIDDVLKWIFNQYSEKFVPYPFINKIKFKYNEPFTAALDFSNEKIEYGVEPAMIIKKLEELGFEFRKRRMYYPKLILYDEK